MSRYGYATLTDFGALILYMPRYVLSFLNVYRFALFVIQNKSLLMTLHQHVQSRSTQTHPNSYSAKVDRHRQHKC